ncbi:MAG: hypothetical protein O3B22_19350 [Proteobacteria bacterium]|nr:hypothetical protein [Pseudomonadota bacterium]
MVAAAPAAWAEGDGGWWLLDSGSWRWVDASTETPYAVAVFGGEGTELNLSDTLQKLFDFQGSSDRLLAVSGTRELAWFRDDLSIEAEAMYGYHYGREVYHEVAATLYARWHAFPWNEYLVTSFAVGVGPSYTTIYPELELQDDPDNRSRLLNQFNLELTVAMPHYPTTSLLVRLQHRSGFFGMLGGVGDASNFLTIGLRQDF